VEVAPPRQRSVIKPTLAERRGVHVLHLGTRVGFERRTEQSRKQRPQRRTCNPSKRQVMIGMISKATMFATLIIGLIAGPAVSLYGSPTVSPVTAAA
jgi:hypothetical protein